MHSMTFLMTNMTFDDDLFVFCFKKTLKSIVGGLNVCKKHFIGKLKILLCGFVIFLVFPKI